MLIKAVKIGPQDFSRIRKIVLYKLMREAPEVLINTDKIYSAQGVDCSLIDMRSDEVNSLIVHGCEDLLDDMSLILVGSSPKVDSYLVALSLDDLAKAEMNRTEPPYRDILRNLLDYSGALIEDGLMDRNFKYINAKEK